MKNGSIIEMFWQGITRRQMRGVQSILELIKCEHPQWLSLGRATETSYIEAPETLKLAMDFYRMRKDAINAVRQCIWIVLALGAFVVTLIKWF